MVRPIFPRVERLIFKLILRQSDVEFKDLAIRPCVVHKDHLNAQLE